MADAVVEPPARRGWTGYQIYVLAMLVLVGAFNYIDRGIISILQEPIKRELRLSDFQLGMLSGPAFGLLYSLASLPIARWAERGNRSTILSLALAVWSGATALCGLAGSYLQLFLMRLGVGLGEGASSPTTYSLVADYFPARQRGIAMATLSTAIPIAGLCAPLIGGVIGQTYGWRTAFIVVGLPGVLLAVVLRLTLRDPRTKATLAARPPSRMWADLRLLFSSRAFTFFWISNCFMGMAIGGTNAFTATYFIREFGFSLKQAGAVTAVGLGVAGLAGTFLGGWLSDRFAGEKGRSYLILPGVGAGLAGLFFLITFTREAWPVALVFLIAANLSTDLKNGTVLAASQNLSPPHMRATTASVTMIAATLFGTTLGPLIVGGVSDAFALSSFAPAFGGFAEACPGGRPEAGAASALVEACQVASAAGMKAGLTTVSVVYFAAMTAFLLSAFSLKQKLED